MRAIRFALRTLFKTPFVTAVAIVSLALGIGANTAIFSLFNEMLLRPLPVTDPRALVNLGAPGPKPGSQSCNQAGDCDLVFSYPMFRDLEKMQTAFTGLAAHRLFGANLAYDGQTLNGDGVFVSGSYFPTLGLAPALGRLIGPDDDGAPGEGKVVVLSYDYWRTRFGASQSVIGQTMIVNGESMGIIGVAPEGFSGTTLGSRPQVYTPISMRGRLEPFFRGFDNRRSYWIYVFGRLKPGVTLAQATTSLNAQYHGIIENVEAPLQTGMSQQTLTRFKARTLTLEPGARGQSSTHERASTPLAMLFAVTGVVLLIACANIANLLLARSAARSNEMAVRLSVGASRRHLIGQLLLESCLLALFGGLAGLVVARGTLAFIQTLLPPEVAGTIGARIDPSVLGFAMMLSVTTGLLFGLFPALHSTRPNLALTLKNQARQASGAKAAARFRTSLVVAQITLSTALLVAAGLFTKSLMNVSRVDLGIKIDHLITFGISPRLNGYSSERSLDLFMRTEEALAAAPGVNSVTASLVPLIAGSNWGTSVRVQDFKADADTDTNSRFNEVGPGFFRTVGIPLLAGREFTAADAGKAPKVAIINEAFAKKFGLGRDAVGKRMGRDGSSGDLDTEIIGLAQNAKYSEVKADVPPLFFAPYRQDDGLGDISFYVRTSIEPEVVLKSIPAVMKQLDPNLPLENLRTMPEQVKQNVFLDRMITTLSASFAVLATLLAGVGLYGVLSYTVAQRTREFGLRMALGANPTHVLRLILRQVAIMTLVGGTMGVIAAVVLGRRAESLLFQMQGRDPVVFTVSVGLLAVIALVAGLVPALRASRTDPMTALRYE